MAIIGSDGVLAAGRLRWLRAVGWMVALAAAIVIAFNGVARATLWAMSATGGTDIGAEPAASAPAPACPNC